MDKLDLNKRAYFSWPTRRVTFMENYNERLIDLLEHTGKKYEGVAFVNTVSSIGKFVTISCPDLRKNVRILIGFTGPIVSIMFLYLISAPSGVCLYVNNFMSVIAILLQAPVIFCLVETPIRIYFKGFAKTHAKKEDKEDDKISKHEEGPINPDQVAILVPIRNVPVTRISWECPHPMFECLMTSIFFLVFNIYLEFQTNLTSDDLEQEKKYKIAWQMFLFFKVIWITLSTLWCWISCAFVVFGQPHAVFSTNYDDEEVDEDKELMDEYDVVEEDDITRLLYPELFCGTEIVNNF